MDSLELNKRITIEQSTLTKAGGGKSVTWSTVAPAWARVRNMSGNERRVTEHGGQVAEARTEFKIRYRAGITEQMRISYGGKKYNIRHINNLQEANRWLLITCDTGVNDG